MRDRATRIALFLAILLLAAFVAEPYVARLFYAEEAPRAVTARGDLAPLERVNIELFERAGAELIDPSCGACIRAGPGASERAEQVTVSAINRNAPGRPWPSPNHASFVSLLLRIGSFQPGRTKWQV